MVDPANFMAGGVHTESARKAWQELPGVSAHVQHWIQHRVWFKKMAHVVDRSAKNSAEVDPSSGKFDQEKWEFLDRKVKELLKCGAVVEMAKGYEPDVITRLSLAPKPGGGSEKFRIIMDMRPENGRHFAKKVKMEHLSHFSTIFRADMLLFSLDLKSAYFSISVDERVARTMGESKRDHIEYREGETQEGREQG